MTYTEEFKQKIRNIYGSQYDQVMEQCRDILGRHLYDASQEDIPVNDILSAVSLDRLQAKARLIKDKRDLYAEWNKQSKT